MKKIESFLRTRFLRTIFLRPVCLIKGGHKISYYYRDGETLEGDYCNYCWTVGKKDSLKRRKELEAGE